MSAVRATKTTSKLTGPASRPVLRVIDHRQQRAKARRRQAMFGIFIFVLAGFFAVATAHAELVSNQRDLDALRQEISVASASNAVLQREVDQASSPTEIVSRAESLGMVRAQDPVYLVAAAPLYTPSVPTLMPPPPADDEVMVAAPAVEPHTTASAFAGSRAVSVGLEAE